MATLIADYDASTLGLSNGAAVTSWPDSAGVQGAHAPSSGAVVYDAAAQNGLGVVRIPTSADYMLATWAVLPTFPFTLYLAGNALSASAALNYWYHQVGPTAFNSLSSQWAMLRGNTLSGGTQDTNFHVWTLLYNGLSSILRVDGTQVATGDTGSAAASASLNQILGGFRFGQMRAYNGDQTAGSDEAQLIAKWVSVPTQPPRRSSVRRA